MCLVSSLLLCLWLREKKSNSMQNNDEKQRNMKPESFLGQTGLCLAEPCAPAASKSLKCYGSSRTKGARPLHFRSSMTDSGCLFSISLRLSSNWTPSVGRRRFWTKERSNQMSTGHTNLPLPSPYWPGPQPRWLEPAASAIQLPDPSSSFFPTSFFCF